MLEKLKGWLSDIAAISLLLAGGIVWWLFGKNRQLEDQLTRATLDKDIAKTLSDKELASKETKNAQSTLDMDSASFSSALEEFDSSRRPPQ